MKRFWRVVLSRTFFLGLLAVAQLAFLIFVFSYINFLSAAFYTFFTIVAVLVAMVVFERDNLDSAYKMMWIALIVIMPVSGLLYYVCFGKRHLAPKKAKILNKIEHNAAAAMIHEAEPMEKLKELDENFLRCADYLSTYAAAPVYGDTRTEYYPFGENFFVRFLEEIKKAKHYIFMEYFIIEEDSRMWQETLAVLRQKAKEGVDVRLLYDSFGCIATLSSGYDLYLNANGIKASEVNSLHLSWSVSDYKLLNHRDHRKITVIDGKTAFSGGINFADEYINLSSPFGVWKDTGFCIQGSGVYSFTVMFLKMWDFATGEQTKFLEYKSTKKYISDGLVQPYGDSPLDDENVAENTYFNILRGAKKYVYIVTPYLIIDSEMLNSLCLAAKSGIDVRILTPAIPDKWYVFLVTRSYYKTLIKAGVRIFEYTPGFVHAKMYLSDDKVAIVGSANMDYRSLYLHFENCCVFYGGNIINEIKEDVVKSIKQSKEMTTEDIAKTTFPIRLAQTCLRFFAPML